VRTPALAKARALASVNPRLCHALEARQYSSNEDGLALPDKCPLSTALGAVFRAIALAVQLSQYERFSGSRLALNVGRNAFDRGVLVIIQKNAVELPAVMPPRRLLVRFYWYGNSTALLKYGHWEGWLYALYKRQGVDIYDSWRTSAGGIDLATGQDGLRFGYGEGEVLAGYDEEEFESEADLDKYFSKKEVVMALEWSKLFVTAGGYQLVLPTNFKALVKYARLQGKTSARKRLPDHLRFPAPRLRDGKWVHDKEWGPWYEPQTGVPA
jgi:hypothetical protein